MENQPLCILLFNEIVGYFESEINNKEKEMINHKLYIKKGIIYFLEAILNKC
jgi:hypothetical protein